MLSTLYIRDFAIVHDMELAFSSGFTILTGETGAGKSIIIDALSLLLGARGDSRFIRHGSERAEITATFAIQHCLAARDWLQENALDDAGECILRRILFPEKPGRAFINGRPVPIQSLREIGQLLVDIHGQHEHQSLLKRDNQRQILDAYGGHQEQVRKLRQMYRELTKHRQQYQEIQVAYANQQARIDLIRFQVDELQQSELREGEFTALEEEHKRLAHASELIQGVQASTFSLYDAEEGSVSDNLAQIVRQLSELSRFDASLNESLDLLQEAGVQIEEAANCLRQNLDRLELEPQRLEFLQNRMSRLIDLGRKHAVSPEELPAVLQAQQQELENIENTDANLNELEQKIGKLQSEFVEISGQIQQKRRKAAKRLSTRINTEMQQLGMEGGQFSVVVEALPESKWDSNGADKIEFQVSANPGQPLKPLSKVASGGELSRISLALQVVIANIGTIPTLIFDEVDVGIGGGIAEVVGRKLRALGGSRQVLCITHLPQVAARGEQQFQVQKQNTDDVQVNIRALQQEERIEEIARMLGGVKITRQTRIHAREMLEQAL